MSSNESDDATANQPSREEPGRENLPLNREGFRVFTSTPGPALDDFQRDTLDVILAERERAKQKPNPLDLPPGEDPPAFDEIPEIYEGHNELDTQPPRKQGHRSYADKGHHPEWTDARRTQQARFWGPYTQTTAASRDSNPVVGELNHSEDSWSRGSVYDPGHPWDPHHDQYWARPHLVPLPKTQWKQRVEKKEMNHCQEVALDAYWDPDLYDPEHQRQGRWVIPSAETLKETNGWEIKMLPNGLSLSDENIDIQPLTHKNLLLWIDWLDALDPAKGPTKCKDWSLKNSDRRVLNWKDQFNPPDYTEIEWMHQYDDDTRDQWEDYLAIHPSEWKMKYQMGNTLPPPADDDFSEWKVKYQNRDTMSPPQLATYVGTNPECVVVAGVRTSKTTLNNAPGLEPIKRGIPGGQKLMLAAVCIALAGGLLGLRKWTWNRLLNIGLDFESDGEEEDIIVDDEENAEARMLDSLSEGTRARKVKRSHPRNWIRSAE